MKQNAIKPSAPSPAALLRSTRACLGIALLLLPSVFWIIRDRTIWPWDQAWYGVVSTDLWYWLWHSPQRWAITMSDGLNLKPPGVVWLGQFFVGLRGLLGSVETSLLLSILLTQFLLLWILYKTSAAMFPESRLLQATAVIFAAGAQLFVGLSHEFLVEPLQGVAAAWALYVAYRSPDWPKARVVIHMGAVLILGALSKADTPVYCLFPLAYAAVQVLRRRESYAFRAELKHRASLVLAVTFALAGLLCALWYVRHVADVWRHIHDATTGDIALYYGARDTIFNKLIIWTKQLRTSFLAPYSIWALLGALILGPLRAILQRTPMAKPIARAMPLAVVSLLQIILLLLAFSSVITVESRFMYALLPYLTIVFLQACALAPRKAVLAFALIGFAQWTAVHAAALFPQYQLAIRSDWLYALQLDPTRYEEAVRAVRVMSEGPEHYNIVGIEEPWFNANSLDFFSAKDRLTSGTRSYFTSLGYAEKDPTAAFNRIRDFHTRFVVTLAEPFQTTPPNFLNLTSIPILERMRRDPNFVQIPFDSRNGVIIFLVGGT